jgi:EAL domain-containing protein (putative c-di-GMP-specific phosphodiesterase class I)
MAAVALCALALLAVVAIQIGALLAGSLYGAAAENAGRDARLMADLGVAAVLADGRLRRSDLRTARAEFEAARRRVPVLAQIVWTPSGQTVFRAGAGHSEQHHGLPKLARAALDAGETQTGYTRDPGVEATIEADVPLELGRRTFVAEYDFSRRGVEADVSRAKRRLYLLVGIAAVLFYVSLLPLLAHVARRLPQPIDPVGKRRLAELRRALDHDELRVHYQPKVDVASATAVGVEALARWRHPRKGLLGPAEFLPHVEESPEMLAAFTERILDRAAGDCARWLREGRELPVAVNIAAAMLLDGPLVATVRTALARNGLEPRLLTLEITEGAIMGRSAEAVAVLAELRALGVAVSIDDFGAGYSSLARLRWFALDELKVDRSLVDGIATDERNRAIVQLIVDLGASFGLRVVAEGVEDEITLGVLETMGCSVAQGFLFARPMPEPRLLEWVETRLPVHRLTDPMASVR